MCPRCGSTPTRDVPKYNPTSNKVYKCVGCYDRVEAGMEPACVASCPSVALFAGEEEDVAAEAKARAEHYHKTFGQEFVTYGTEKVSEDVGKTGWVTVAPKEDAEQYGLKDNPTSPTLNVRKATSMIAGVGTIGLVGAVGVHFMHWLGKRKQDVGEKDTAQPDKQREEAS